MVEIIEAMERFAPLNNAEDGDNVGFLIGRRNLDVMKVLLALDITDDIVKEAVQNEVNVIITHHPAIRSDGLKNINDDTPKGSRLLTLIEKHIAVYSAHTNLDACEGGINDMLFDIIGLQQKEYFSEMHKDVYAGRAGILPIDMTVAEFACFVQKKLRLPNAIYVGDGSVKVGKIGIIGGGSADEKFFSDVAKAGCNTFVTSDIRYGKTFAAVDMGLNLIEATHYGSEIVFAKGILPYLQENLPSVEFIVSKIDGQPFKNANGGTI